MKMSVDGEQCMGHGRCYRLLPHLLSSDDEGFVTIRGQTMTLAQKARDLLLRGVHALGADDLHID